MTTLREKVEALATEWEREAKSWRDLSARYFAQSVERGDQRLAESASARDSTNTAHAAALRAALASSTAPAREPRCKTCGDTGLVDDLVFVPDAPGWAPDSKPCPDCPDDAPAPARETAPEQNAARETEGA